MRTPITAKLALAALMALGASYAAARDYVDRIAPQYETFAGSRDNLESLAAGLRQGKEVTLTAPGETTASFTPTTRPMGYGNITRALDLTSRKLAADGITSPTPQELSAAMQDVLQLRSQGMGWGKIAHTIGVHPSGHASATALSHSTPAHSAPSSSGITTAAGGRGVVYGRSAQSPGPGAAPGLARASGIQGAGGVNGNAGGNGNGKSAGHGRSGK